MSGPRLPTRQLKPARPLTPPLIGDMAPPAVKSPNKKTAASKKLPAGKKGARNAAPSDGFPIPLSYLYRDPRPAIVRRQQQAAASAPDCQVSWSETDGDGMPIKETPERLREKKTLFTANMAQASAFEAKHRHGDARDACTRVSAPFSRLACNYRDLRDSPA